ncbi:MAG: prevent-host-death protein [Pelomonas sp.]|nr:prevent-host-death protein [Roseateles sp.]
MKSASLPPIRVEPEFREQLEGALQSGETLSSFMEDAIRAEVRKRQVDAEFRARGLASLARVRAGEPTYTTEEVVTELRAKLDAARQVLAERNKAKA